MKQQMRRGLIAAAGAVATAAAVAVAAGPVQAADAFASSSVPANPRSGVQDNALAPGLDQTAVAYGNLPLSNPDTVTAPASGPAKSDTQTVTIDHYGYDRTSAAQPLTQDPHEAYKTEPDKNAYLVLGGHHYLYQGHEGGPAGYVTRIDLDTHEIRLIADKGTDGFALPTFDGITWDPFSKQLLLTAEAASPNGGVWAVPLDGNGDSAGPVATRLRALGSGGFEGVQNDSDGNVWLVEDIGGKAPAGHAKSKYPNSYVYRFRPTDPADLTAGGTLQALQVHRSDGSPVTAGQLANGTDQFLTDLHTYGSSFATSWVDVSPSSSTAPYGFDATAAAKAAGATPFKRPENGVFRPGTSFGEFYFTETGDTNADSDVPGAYGGVFRVSQSAPSAATGTLSPAYLGDKEHTGLDNICFATVDQLLVVEDAGDTLHQQRNALDSGYLIDLRKNYAKGLLPIRWLAEGRDASATYDATTSPGYNDGDNEITGIHVSDGDPSTGGILGAKAPQLFTNGWRTFWTQQHGDNITREVAPSADAPARSKG